MEVKTQIFSVPTSTGTADFNISGWTTTPDAAIFILIGTDGTNSFDNDGYLSVGFTDGTSEGCEGMWTEDAQTTTDTRRHSDDAYVIRTSRNVTLDMDFSAAFSQWNSGGVELTWSGTDIASNAHQVKVIFFAGTDVSADCFYATGDVTSMSFTSKLIFTACSGQGSDAEALWANLCFGVCTNGTNGVTQQSIEYNNEEAVSTTEPASGILTDIVSSQEYMGYTWTSAISNIDSSGFDFDAPSGGDRVLFLCLTFDDDVDCGYSSIPTSGNINVTDPGFTPQFVGLIGSNNDGVGTDASPAWDEDIDPQGMWFGSYDGTREISVGISSEDGATTTNETSWHSSEILHFEDPDQTDIFESSAVSFDSSGFDITVATNPSTATYYLWWAVESGTTVENITGSIATSSTVTGDVIGRAMISGGMGLGADLKDGENINDDANWTAYGTTTISQNGSYVNFIGGNDVRAAYVDLDTSVLTLSPTDGTTYVTRGKVWSESGAINISLHGSTSGELDSTSIGDGEIIRFALYGVEEAGGVNNLEYSGVAASEEFNTLIYSVHPVLETSVSGNLTATKNVSGSIAASSTVTGDISSSQKNPIAGTITTSSSVTGNVQGTGSISGSPTGSSTVSGVVVYPDIVSQNGSWVNIIAGTKSTRARMYLDTDVLTSAISDGQWYVVRVVVWSESGDVTVTLHDEGVGGSPRDSEDITSGDVVQFELYGVKYAGDIPYITFTNFATDEELNIFIYTVAEIVGSTVTGDISFQISGDYVSGTIYTSSTVSGALLGNTELSATVSTSSTVTADIVGKYELSGTISASSSIVGDIIGTTELSGSISASSTVTGNAISQKIAGSITTFSTITGGIQAIVPIAGSITTASTVTGDCIRKTNIEGSITTSSTVTGTISAKTSIRGTILTESIVSGSVGWIEEISGSISASTTVTADITPRTSIEGSITTGSTMTGLMKAAGRMTVTAPTATTIIVHLSGIFELSGSAFTSSTVTGNLIIGKQRKWISGSTSTSSTVSGSIRKRVRSPLSGIVVTSSTIVGDLITWKRFISGTVSTESMITGVLTEKPPKDLSGTISTGTSVTADLFKKQRSWITTSVITVSVVSGDLTTGKRFISGSITTSTTVTGDVSKSYISLSGSVSTGSSISGDISYDVQLRGIVYVSSTLTGTALAQGTLQGTILGSSQVSGFWKAYNRRTVAVSTSSTVFGDIVIGAQKGPISGAVSTATTMAAAIWQRVKSRITGSVTTATVLTAAIWKREKGRILASVSATSTVAGDLSIAATKIWGSGTIVASSTVTGVARVRGILSGTVSASSAVSGELIGVGLLEGTVITASTVVGAVQATGILSGTTTASTTLSGKVFVRVSVSGSISTGSTVDGHLSGKYGLEGTMVTYSQIIGDLGGIGVLGGISLTHSLVEGTIREKGVPRDWWDIVVPSDTVEVVVPESEYVLGVVEDEYKLGTMEYDEGMWVYEPTFNLVVVEDDFRIGSIEGSGEGAYLTDHDDVLILDHDGNKIPI